MVLVLRLDLVDVLVLDLLGCGWFVSELHFEAFDVEVCGWKFLLFEHGFSWNVFYLRGLLDDLWLFKLHTVLHKLIGSVH